LSSEEGLRAFEFLEVKKPERERKESRQVYEALLPIRTHDKGKEGRKGRSRLARGKEGWNAPRRAKRWIEKKKRGKRYGGLLVGCLCAAGGRGGGERNKLNNNNYYY